MVDIEDNNTWGDEIPYRLVSMAYDANSPQYHRAVFLCLQEKHLGHIELGTRNNHDLFVSRRKVGWKKNDSLFDAWLLANYKETRPIFNLELFTRYLKTPEFISFTILHIEM